MSAIAGTIAFFVIEEEEQRIHDEPEPEAGDLVLNSGSFLVCETGVTAKLSPPLGFLSRHYEWKWVPPGIGALRLAVLGEGDTPSTLYRFMNERQKDQLEMELGKVYWTCEEHKDFLEHNSTLADDVSRIWDWMPSLVSKCPYQSVIHDINMVRDMSDQELDSYVMAKLL